MNQYKATNPVVYRFFDADDRLLYVGCTVHFKSRMSQHKTEYRWFADVVRIDTVEYASHAEALNDEKAAIKAEQPRYNKRFNEAVYPYVHWRTARAVA